MARSKPADPPQISSFPSICLCPKCCCPQASLSFLTVQLFHFVLLLNFVQSGHNDLVPLPPLYIPMLICSLNHNSFFLFILLGSCSWGEMMKAFVLLALSLSLLFAASNSMGFVEKDLQSEESLWDLYQRWRSHHTVSRNLAEKHKRFNVFKDNVNFIHSFNKKDAPYKLKLNKFGDMTNQEFKRTYAGSRINHHRMRQSLRGTGSFMYENATDIPPAVDWRQKGAVTPVKNQGRCGKLSNQQHNLN